MQREALATSVLLVGRHETNVSWGDFYIWLADDRALVRLYEHGERYAIDPARGASPAAGDTWFKDSDGSAFPAQDAETVSRSQAFEALGHWLRTGEMLTNLAWGRPL